MVRLKMAVAGVAAGVLAGGLAMPPAASADTTQVVYAWGDNQLNQAGVDNQVAGTEVLSPVPVHGAAANVTQLSGPTALSRSCCRCARTARCGAGAPACTPRWVTRNRTALRRCRSRACHRASSRSRAAAPMAPLWPRTDRCGRGAPINSASWATPGPDSPTPHQVPGLSGVKQVGAGSSFTVALRSNGEVWTWGRNEHGQLGDGTHTDRTTRPATWPCTA